MHGSMLHTAEIKINRLWENKCYLGETSGTTIQCPKKKYCYAARKTSLSATHLVTGVIRLCPWCFLVVSLVDSLGYLLIYLSVISRSLPHKARIPTHLQTSYLYSYRYIIRDLRVLPGPTTPAQPLLVPSVFPQDQKLLQPSPGLSVPASTVCLAWWSPALSITLPPGRTLALLSRQSISWMDPQTDTSFCPKLESKAAPSPSSSLAMPGTVEGLIVNTAHPMQALGGCPLREGTAVIGSPPVGLYSP